jgi:hypothetical protein
MPKHEEPSLETIASLIERATNDINYLSRATFQLSARIIPYIDEEHISYRAFPPERAQKPKSASLLDIMQELQNLSKRLRGSEYDLRSIRSTLDRISSDNWSLANFRPYLDQPRERD